MNLTRAFERSGDARDQTKERAKASAHWETLFLGDWVSAVFLHYEVPADILQPQIPFRLDLREGRAYVSLVAFTMSRLRPRFGRRLTEWLFAPIGATRFLNVRTYVVHGGERGIYFMAEFLSNPLCVPLGRPTFGLPYHRGQVQHHHDPARGRLAGEITASQRSRKLCYIGTIDPQPKFRSCVAGSLDEFLMERYTAFTWHRWKRRLFRISHEPWSQKRAEIVVRDEGLLADTGGWATAARPAGANFSPGVRDVRMGWPEPLRGCRGRRVRVFFDA